jgi:hypothetical protein
MVILLVEMKKVKKVEKEKTLKNGRKVIDRNKKGETLNQ